MKAVLLAGGLGTRLEEEIGLKPKPMVEVGGKPILWHIMKNYSEHGVTEFIICLGYKGYLIKEYFSNYFLHLSDITLDMDSNTTKTHQNAAEPWKITLVDTGESTMTGGRLKRVQEYIKDEESFCMTYGDAVGDVDITELMAFHKEQGSLATVTATQPPGRFGALNFTENKVTSFKEKPEGDGNWINGGFFVLSPKVLDYIEGDDSIWEKGPVDQLAAEGQLSARKHHGFWQPMDTLRDKQHLESLWDKGNPPWKTW